MKRLLVLVIGLALSGTGSLRAQRDVWVTVLNARGLPVMGFAPGTEPYKSDVRPQVLEHLDGSKPVRDPQRRVVSAFGFYGWRDGANVRIVVLSQVPAEGADNRFYASHEQSSLRFQEFAHYMLA